MTADGSPIDLDLGPLIDAGATKNYKILKEILLRLTRLCVQDMTDDQKPRKHEQRLLRNMGAHTVVLELLQITYDKVQQVANHFILIEELNILNLNSW